MARKTETITVRLTPETRAKIAEAQRALPYVPTITSLVERGIVLALNELNRMAHAAEQEPK
jgi:hypothetical protein